MTEKQLERCLKLGLEPTQLIKIVRAAYLATQAGLFGQGEQLPVAWPQGRGQMISSVLNLLSDPDQSLAALHGYWLGQMASRGWTWGPVLDIATREHPFMQPWQFLNQEQRRHIVYFRTAVLKARHGLQKKN